MILNLFIQEDQDSLTQDCVIEQKAYESLMLLGGFACQIESRTLDLGEADWIIGYKEWCESLGIIRRITQLLGFMLYCVDCGCEK